MPQLERELPALDQPPSGSPPPTGPCVMIIFGGTGDLTSRKLFPAIYNLVKSKLLSSDFAILELAATITPVNNTRRSWATIWISSPPAR